MMAHLPGLKNYSHCPLKKRPLSFISEFNTDDDQPQDLRIKKRRHESDEDVTSVGKSTTPPPTEAHTSAHTAPVAAYPTPACSPPRMTSLADFYLKLFQSSAVQQQTYEPPPQLWRQTPMWPLSQSPAHSPVGSPHHHHHHAHSYLASHLASSPQPTEERLASPGSTASEDSGVGTETLSEEDDIDVIGDNHSQVPTTTSAYESSGSNAHAARGAEARYACTECRKSYSTYSGLTKHKQFHCVSLGNKSFGCKHCDKVYTSLGALKMHIRTHTLPCKCPLCGKAFSRPWLLQGHIRTHTGEKPFQCSQCDRSFADRSNLRAHLQTHADVKKYACNTCHKTFSRMSLLNKHTESSCLARMVPQQQEFPRVPYVMPNQ